jgi:hypothetical protein
MQPRSQHPYSPRSDIRRAPDPPMMQALVPPLVRFIEQTETDYTVGELGGPRTALVPKQRAVADPFPAASRHQRSDRRLVRWSLYALVGASCGGVMGIVLGGTVAIVAMVRLAQFSMRVKRWRRGQRTHGATTRLPAAAMAERRCLMAAVGQGLLAAAAGLLVLLLLIGFL